MAKILITTALQEEIISRFKSFAEQIFLHMKSLEDYPHKGKAIGHVGGIVIKEIRYQTYRFYCITDGHLLKFGSKEELANLLIKFVRMSEKKDQQRIITEIKNILRSMGFEGT